MISQNTIKLDTMNIELTTNCPLRCPQCYCSLTGGKNIDLQSAIFWIKEGGQMGVKDVMLSGGETLCYPYIYEVIRAAREYCGSPNISLSGYHFNQETFDKLIESGTERIFISLNGSTEQINSKTRDGYNFAISALELLKKNKFPNTVINWVMHSNNADDFINIVNLAEQYGVSSIDVIGVKPDSRKNLSTIPSREQMLAVKNTILSNKQNVKIYIESCFSPLLALVSDTKLFGNLNVGKYKGCAAGRSTFSVNVDGLLSPCRHLEYFEAFDNLQDYFEKSKIQQKLRSLEYDKKEPCLSCRYTNNCRHCLAINAKINHELYIGNQFCPLKEEKA